MRRDKPTSHTADPLMRNTTDVTSAKPDPNAPPPGETPVPEPAKARNISGTRNGTSGLAEANPRPCAGDQNLFTMSKTNFEGPKAVSGAGAPAAAAARANPTPNPCFHHHKQRTGALPAVLAKPASSRPGPLTFTPAPAGPGETNPGKPALVSRRGGAGRSRTDDLLRAKQALSQLSYGP